ncbi:putative aminoacyltransferase, E1 ubiquitin-activating enzyme [Rosa chinensis]|uniref:RING-type E3 ubiquitin transferase n=1 Tax=Rosa chinensis TaxID=74649 RepID=A0A2P6Q532_ROSCH|nr:U-box domain-containing protein 17 [Rosa chinensis]PRQ29254.1 putative aminoacyltransferase, E1 ubiquitin-activating enzyme [Rosa chinensis]
MASAAIFSSLRRRRSPSLEAFLAPVDLSDVALVQTLVSVTAEIVSSFSDKLFYFQRRNSRSLVRKVEVFLVLLESLNDSAGSTLPWTAVICLKELYLLLYRSKILLDYCAQSSKLWLLLQHHPISGHFHDLNQEISTLLDVFPIDDVELGEDVREQIELLQRQARRARLLIDEADEELRIQLFGFLDEFDKGRVPNSDDVWVFFDQRLGIRDAKSCRHEIEFLEEQIVNHEGDVEPTVSVLNGFVAFTRYCRFLLFGFEEDEVGVGVGSQRKPRKGLISQEIAETFITIPKDFSCPISLDLMREPVIISTGQTYDRISISRWLEEGHCTCPKTGQMLPHTRLVPNRALRNLILQWCTAYGVPYDSPDHCTEASAESFAGASPSKAALAANRATAGLLIKRLAEDGSTCGQTIAAREIRLLAKTGRENRAFIAEAGAIPHLRKLLSSPNSVAQENSVTAMLNLSIYDKNKSRIMDEEGCLGSIVDVLRFGHTTEARENAAATLFSLSAVHDYKKRIADEEGGIEALAGLLLHGTQRGKKDAVTALFNLSTHTENCTRMVEAGAVTALVSALGIEGVAEESAGALALIVRQPSGATAVGKEEMAVAGLIGMMRCGTPRGKENAVAALLELCRHGGAAATERVVKAPSLAGLLQTLLFTGTKRARRKAASLARVFQRCENASTMHYGGLGVGYAFAGNSAVNRDTSFVGDVSVQMSISVPVL